MSFLRGVFIDIGEYQTNVLRDPTTGETNQAVDGEVVPRLFCYTVPEGFSFYIFEMHAALRDNGTFQGDRFGAIGGGGLDVGVSVFLTDPTGTQIKDLLDGLTIQTNTDWGLFGGARSVLINTRGMNVTWTYRSGLRLTNRFSYCSLIRDDVTPLLNFRMAVQGVLIDEATEEALGIG